MIVMNYYYSCYFSFFDDMIQFERKERKTKYRQMRKRKKKNIY